MMMILTTSPDTPHDLAALLEEAVRVGGVRILRPDGQTFLLVPDPMPRSPLDVPGIDLSLSASEIVEAVREGRDCV